MPKSTTKTKRPRGKVKRSAKATIKKLKSKVRRRIEKGESLTAAAAANPIRSREVQMKIAHIEAQIREAEKGTKTRGRRAPAAEVRLSNEIATLRRRLK